MEEPFIITVVQDLANMHELVNSFFKDKKKTTKWMNSTNPMLGNQKPIQMIFAGRTQKLKTFIEGQLEENEVR